MPTAHLTEDDIEADESLQPISFVEDGQSDRADNGMSYNENHLAHLTGSSEDEDHRSQQVLHRQMKNLQGFSVQRSNFTRASTAERLIDDESLFASEVGDLSSGREAKAPGKRVLNSIRESEFVYPLSQYDGYVPPLPIAEEESVIEEFISVMSKEKTFGANASFNGEEYVEFNLVDFSIYLPGINTHYGWEMRGLQNLATKAANSCYFFDGILTTGEAQRYVQKVPFKICSIGNYGVERDTVGNDIWIQSEANAKSDIYYRLKAPSREYARYHQGFLWLANLAKHFIDYSQYLLDDGQKVSIHNFREDFAHWLEKTHEQSSHFRNWYMRHNSPDFRRAISANINFLFKEAIGVLDVLQGQPIWEELMTMTAIPAQPTKESLTIVTPYVYDCFSHLKFGHILKRMVPVNDVEKLQKSRVESLHLTAGAQFGDHSTDVNDEILSQTHQLATEQARKEAMKKMLDQNLDISSIKVGDVLGVVKDGKGSLWKDELSKWRTTDDCWYVFVQKIHLNKKNIRSFEVIWLYKPADTICALMKYPHNDELFFSDNCSCSSQRIFGNEVICKVDVAWNGEPGSTRADFFVRQTYLHDNSFVTLKEKHKQCLHLRDDHKTPLQDLVDAYEVGDTVLVIPPRFSKSRRRLEPGEILAFNQDGAKGEVVVRRLIRRHEFDGTSRASPNELIYSDESFVIPADHVQRACLIRFYTRGQVDRREVPAPYNRDGTGDAYYITSRLVDNAGILAVEEISSDDVPHALKQGYDPTSEPTRKVLRGMDLYCGGGNFGRGLEEGGAVHFDWALDINENAIHTYFANLKDTTSTKLFLGSVDDFLAQAMKGNPHHSPLIPLPGQIDFIAAGSPCTGFSLLSSRRDGAKGLKNQSLVADVAANIDFYRPKYALLENVISMAQKGRGRDEDVLSQLICCIVGMGYQVQLFNLDAWSFGSPQTRSRLFVSIAAPGAELPPHPALSHSHPAGTVDRGLGKMSNGQAFGNRLFPDYTPFDFVTVQEATDDLPDIGDGKPDHCTSHPDHRMSKGVKHKLKAQMEAIPMVPRGMNFAKTWASGKGKMTKTERDLFPVFNKKGAVRQNVLPDSHAWQRVNPQKLFQTIATAVEPQCGRTGRVLHWEQQRLITVMEVRRAQGFPDIEVLTGIPTAQWKIVGNSVARTISMALGLSLRQAWLKNQPDELIDKGFLSATTAEVSESGGSPRVNVRQRFQDPFAAARRRKENESSAEMSSDDTASSSRRHRRIEQLRQLKSSTSHSDKSSVPGSSASSDQECSNSRKRRFNLREPAPTGEPKKRKLLGPASVRGPGTLWQPNAQQQRTLALAELRGTELRRPGKERATTPTLKAPHSKPTVLIEHSPVAKKEHSNSVAERESLRLGKASKVATSQPLNQFPRAKGTRSQHKKPTVKEEPGRPVKVINLISDDEGDAEDEGEGEDVEIVSVRTVRQMYENVDNTIFKPYEQTYARMGRPSPRPM